MQISNMGIPSENESSSMERSVSVCLGKGDNKFDDSMKTENGGGGYDGGHFLQ